MTFPPEVWSGVLRRLRDELPAFTFEAWIAPLEMGAAHDDRIVVLCPTPFHRDRIKHSLREPIAKAFGDTLGGRPTLDFDVANTDAAQAMPASGLESPAGRSEETSPGRAPRPTDVDATVQPPTDLGAAARPRSMRRVRADAMEAKQRRTGTDDDPSEGPLAQAIAQTTSGLRVDRSGRLADPTGAPGGASTTRRDPHAGTPSTRQQGHPARSAPGQSTMARGGQRHDQQLLPYPFSFDNFVVGPCNALAREAAFAVAGGQKMALKQLYLASPPGLGKTHLARAVASEVAQKSPRPVRYASAELFTSEFVSALRAKTTTEFKRRYRPERGGLLVIEDVQFLAAKRATQLEFFHSVQHVLDAGGRVLLTGDRMPQDMTDLDERVREQLAGGFVAGLEPPDAMVRRQILKTKAANGAIGLPEECLDLLVSSVSGNVRELESVLMQVVTTCTLLKRPIDLELTERAIAQKVQSGAPRKQGPEIGDVLAVVASFFKTRPETLAARSRKRAVLVPRQLAMYLCHRHTDAPLAEIGRALDRDHPSVRNAIKKVEREMLESPRLRYQVEALTTAILERVG